MPDVNRLNPNLLTSKIYTISRDAAKSRNIILHKRYRPTAQVRMRHLKVPARALTMRQLTPGTIKKKIIGCPISKSTSE